MSCNISLIGPDRLFSDRSRVCTPPDIEVHAAGTLSHLLAQSSQKMSASLCAVHPAVSAKQEHAH